MRTLFLVVATLSLCSAKLYNAALKKTATQSSTSSGGAASRAVDGKVDDSKWSSKSCIYTSSGYATWWQVDLGKFLTVDHVIITARTDRSGANRIDGYTVYVGGKKCGSAIKYKSGTVKYTLECGGLVGKVVRVEKSAEVVEKLGFFDKMQMCEVQVMVDDGTAAVKSTSEPGYVVNDGWVNVALNKPTKTSAYSRGKGKPGYAVDGYAVCRFSRNSCWSSDKADMTWFEVDLGAVYQLDHIVIYGRNDRDQEKLMGAKVYVGKHLCTVLDSPTSKAKALTVKCQAQAMIGSTVRIEHKSEYLVLCEVKAMVKESEMDANPKVVDVITDYADFTNVALGKKAKQSSRYKEYYAQRAVDGWTKHSDMDDNSCAYTEDDEPEWWSVDLGSIMKVDHVIVLGRSDSKPEKIDGVSVYLGWKLCGTIKYVKNQYEYTVQCDNAAGQTVTLQRSPERVAKEKDFENLQICEVQVMVAKKNMDTEISSTDEPWESIDMSGDSDYANVAWKRPSTQSSTSKERVAARGNDGYTLQDEDEKACSCTDKTGNEFWEVTLEKNYKVHHVNIWGREDNWYTVGAEVWVGHQMCGVIPESKTNMVTVTCPEMKGAGKVRIAHALKNIIICEVEVMVLKTDLGTEAPTFPPPAPSTYKNVAKDGTAMQSSTRSEGVASRGVDGFALYRFDQDSCTYTDDNEPVEWWKVTLDKTYPVHSVNVFGRTDKDMERLDGAVITVNGTTIGVIHYVTGDTNWIFPAHGLRGGEVKVTLPHSEHVSVCEVQVMVLRTDEGEDSSTAKPTPYPTHLASNKLATMSGSIYSEPGAAVDGVTEGNFYRGSCIQTAPAQRPWWSVDLGSSSDIGMVRVYPRLDKWNGAQVIDGAQVFAGSNLCGVIDYVPDVQYYELDCRGASASEVTLKKIGWLSFCEVMVFESS